LDRCWSDSVFISGDNHHLISWFCGLVLGPTTISKMVSESPQDPLSHLLSCFRYQATHHLCPRTKPNSAGREGGVKSLTQDKCWSDNVFVSRDNPHLTNRFCGVVLGPITIFKMEGNLDKSKIERQDKARQWSRRKKRKLNFYTSLWNHLFTTTTKNKNWNSSKVELKFMNYWFGRTLSSKKCSY